MTAFSVFGIGYVGIVAAACLARDGHMVVAVDVDPAKVEAVSAGRAPIVEPGLDALVAETVASGRLQATGDATAAVAATDVPADHAVRTRDDGTHELRVPDTRALSGHPPTWLRDLLARLSSAGVVPLLVLG